MSFETGENGPESLDPNGVLPTVMRPDGASMQLMYEGVVGQAGIKRIARYFSRQPMPDDRVDMRVDWDITLARSLANEFSSPDEVMYGLKFGDEFQILDFEPSDDQSHVLSYYGRLGNFFVSVFYLGNDSVVRVSNVVPGHPELGSIHPVSNTDMHKLYARIFAFSESVVQRKISLADFLRSDRFKKEPARDDGWAIDQIRLIGKASIDDTLVTFPGLNSDTRNQIIEIADQIKNSKGFEHKIIQIAGDDDYIYKTKLLESLADHAGAEFVQVPLIGLISQDTAPFLIDDIENRSKARKQIVLINMDDLVFAYIATGINLSDEAQAEVCERAIRELTDCSENVTVFVSTRSAGLEAASDEKTIVVNRPNYERRVDLIGAQLVKGVSFSHLRRPKLFTAINIQEGATCSSGMTSSEVNSAVRDFIKYLKKNPAVPLATLNSTFQEILKNKTSN